MGEFRVAALLPLVGLTTLVVFWAGAVVVSGTELVPGPFAVLLATLELAGQGLLFRYVVASLFRVSWGFSLAVLSGVPLGLFLGWFRSGEQLVNPFLQLLRPISPLAWIPIAILWFGVGDLPAVFIIYLASLFPITVATMNAVSQVDAVHINAGRNFGLSPIGILRAIVVPSVLPQIVSGLRITLGIAWLVVVAAEMIAVNSGLGFLIVDARNAGNRYDRVIAGMIAIGVIGLVLDFLMQRLEQLSFVRGAVGANPHSMRHVQRRRLQVRT